MVWHGLLRHRVTDKTTTRPVLSAVEGMAVLPGHGGGFDFEEQVGAADVADDRYPGPVESLLVSFKYLFDLGCLAIGDYMHDVLVATVHITEHGADVLDGRFDLARSVADMCGLAVGINRGGSGDEYRMARRRDCLRSSREG